MRLVEEEQRMTSWIWKPENKPQTRVEAGGCRARGKKKGKKKEVVSRVGLPPRGVGRRHICRRALEEVTISKDKQR